MRGDEGVVAQVRVRGADPINLLDLAGAEGLAGIEIPDAGEQPLSPQLSS
jgi:hypothetical protein